MFLNVPCGECQECQNQKQQEYLTRLAYEYEYCKAIGGYVLFETLTYNEENVPRLHGLMCFNKEHYTSFANKLRTYLVRHYEKQFYKNLIVDGNNADTYFYPYLYSTEYEEIETDIDSEDEMWMMTIKVKNQPTKPEYCPIGKIKIFFVSEYGGEYGRPHYHMIIFVEYKISPVAMCYYIRKAWIYGFVDARKPEEKICNSMKSIAYVAKYVCKDIEWTRILINQKNSKFRKYLEIKWRQIYGEELDERLFKTMPCKVVKKILKEIDMDSACPFIKVSRHLGEYGLTKINNEALKQNSCVIMDSKRGTAVVPIPMYLRRKKMYDYDKKIKYWQLNDTGKLIKALQQETQYDNVITELEDTFTEYIKITGLNQAYFQKMYADIKRNKHTWQKLVNCIYMRDKIITKEIIEWINNEPKKMLFEYSKEICDTLYITKYNHNTPFDWVLKAHLKKKILTVDEFLRENGIKDERFKEIMIVYDDCQAKIKEYHEAFLIRKAEAEHKVKQLKYG